MSLNYPVSLDDIDSWQVSPVLPLLAVDLDPTIIFIITLTTVVLVFIPDLMIQERGIAWNEWLVKGRLYKYQRRG